MIRVAFTLIGGKNWTGGYNYFLNLVQVLGEHAPNCITPVLFFGEDTEEAEIDPFSKVPGVEIVRTKLMNKDRKIRSLMLSVLFGVDHPVREMFKKNRIDLVFEAAQFFGSRIGIPALAWMPDFQHRLLPHLFSKLGYWKRELGFRVQIAAGRNVMLSSEDSRQVCEQCYPQTKGRTHVVRFAVPFNEIPSHEKSREVADIYSLPQDFIFLPNQFWKHKNHLLVIEALSILRDRGCDVVVATTGKKFDPRDSTYFNRVQDAVKLAKLENNFRIIGLIPYEYLAPLMCASLALLNPSLFEGWSTTVEEARSLGIPMILSDLPVHREQAGNNAIYFDRFSAVSLADAIQSLQNISLQERNRRCMEGLLSSKRRVEIFAEEFVSVVNYSLAHFNY